MDKLVKFFKKQTIPLPTFLKSQNLAIVFKQTSWQLTGKLAASVSTLLILGLVSRRYQASGTGIFTLALAYLAVFYMVADLGINAHVIQRFLGQNLEQEWRKLLGVRITLAILLMMVAVAGVWLWPNTDSSFKQSIYLGAGAILGSALFVSANAIFQFKQRFDLSAAALSLGAFLALILTYGAISQDLGVPALLVGQMAGWLLCGSLALYLAGGYSKIWPIFDFNYLKQVIVQSWPLFTTLLLNVIYFRIDSFLLAAFKPFADVGIYNLAFGVFQFMLVIPTFVMNSFYPIMLKIFNEEKNLFTAVLTKAGVALFGIGFLGTLATFVLGLPAVVIISGGGEFGGSAASLWILSMGFPAFFASALLMWTLVVLKRYHLMLAIYAAGLIVNISLNLWLIPQYSFLAASAVTAISEYIILLMQIAALVKIFKNPQYKISSGQIV